MPPLRIFDLGALRWRCPVFAQTGADGRWFAIMRYQLTGWGMPCSQRLNTATHIEQTPVVAPTAELGQQRVVDIQGRGFERFTIGFASFWLISAITESQLLFRKIKLRTPNIIND